MADNSILMRLDGLKLKYEETGQKLTDPEVIADVKQFVQLTKEFKELEPIIETSERYRTALANLAEAKDILANDKDEEMREMARMEISELEPALEKMEEDIKLLLIPKDPQDENKFVVVDALNLDEIKTKKFVEVMNNLKVEKALVVLNDMNENVIASAKNVPTVKTAQTNEINVFDILKYDTVVVTKDAVKTIEEVYA